MGAMTDAPKSKPKLTDAERHARFVDTARLVQVDESPEAFDRAFERVIRPPVSQPESSAKPQPGSQAKT